MPQRVCRTCLHGRPGNRYVSLGHKSGFPHQGTVRKMLKSIIPELNLQAVIDPVICKNCLWMLQTCCTFKKICLETEKKLLEQMRAAGAESMHLNYLPDENWACTTTNCGSDPEPAVSLKKEVIDDDEVEKTIVQHLLSSSEENIDGKTGLFIPVELIKIQIDSENQDCNTPAEKGVYCMEVSTHDNASNYPEHQQNKYVAENGTASSAEPTLFSQAEEQNPDNVASLPTIQARSKNEDQSGFNAASGIKITETQDESFNNVPAKESDVNEIPGGEIKEVSQSIADLENEVDALVASVLQKLKERKNKSALKSETPPQKIKFNLTCSECEASCVGFEEAALHAKCIHKRDRIVCCRFCKKIFYTMTTYRYHTKTHGCYRKTLSYLHLKRKCRKCDVTFRGIPAYCKHMAECHNKKFPTCGICRKYFSTARQLKFHHCQRRRKSTFLCDQCGKQFTKRSKLTNHKLVHTAEKKYMCELCGAQFKYISSLKKHRACHESTPQCCPVCDKQFKTYRHLKIHMERHKGRAQYVCELCGHRFNFLAKLRRHLVCHKTDKLFSCKSCGQQFTRKLKLDHHLSLPSSCQSEENKHPCQFCARKFKNAQALTLHLKHQHQYIRTETDRVLRRTCPICGKVSSTVGNNKKHLRVHSEEKPHGCEVCGKRFKSKQEVATHLRRHTGEKPYRCSLCEMAFVDHGGRLKHMRAHYQRAKEQTVRDE